MKFAEDKGVHRNGYTTCVSCYKDYPIPCTEDSCTGLIHGELLTDIEANIQFQYISRQCDKCDKMFKNVALTE